VEQSLPKGKLIALYGVNNLGKTSQVKLLAERLRVERGVDVCELKFALYDLKPTGPILNGYLREGNPHKLTATEFQLVQTMNRQQYDSALRGILAKGVWVVAEDYRGTGIAWGMGAGADKELLVKLNSTLCPEDLCILIDGDRFATGREEKHKHESNNDLWDRVRGIHLDLAREWGWTVVKNAGRSKEEIHEEVWQHVLHHFAAAH
jgi:thymidylate kinase